MSFLNIITKIFCKVKRTLCFASLIVCRSNERIPTLGNPILFRRYSGRQHGKVLQELADGSLPIRYAMRIPQPVFAFDVCSPLHPFPGGRLYGKGRNVMRVALQREKSSKTGRLSNSGFSGPLRAGVIGRSFGRLRALWRFTFKFWEAEAVIRPSFQEKKIAYMVLRAKIRPGSLELGPASQQRLTA